MDHPLSRLSNASKLAGAASALMLVSFAPALAQDAVQSAAPGATPQAAETPNPAASTPPPTAAASPSATTPVVSPTAASAAPTTAAQPSTTPSPAASPPAAPTGAPAAAPGATEAAHDIIAPDAPSAPTMPTAMPAPASLVNAEKLPRDLSPWSMFMQADIVVKSVMIGLIFASIVTWTVWLAKSIELAAARRRMRTALKKLGAANSINEAVSLVDAKRGAVPAMLRAAIAETRASWDVADKYAIKERVAARLERIEFAAGRDINRGTGVLATIGSTAPFVGLFGTVWGIMNSFIGISEAQTTNLAIVAPGIAEALLATAFGLVAAIPAVMIYNHFARAIGSYKALVGDASVAVLCLVSRDFDRGVRPELRAAE
ncbi:MAG: tonB-system energizer ExbB [Hyphomicrobium sp.]|nr:MAG: tonB-system energizer ExbB [Hyphomicrobium sp.]